MLKDTQTPRYAQRRTHRTYTAQFKAELVALCHKPGASIAALALQHGMNANLLHRLEGGLTPAVVAPQTPAFISIGVNTPASAPTGKQPIIATSTSETDIRIECQRPGLSVIVHWPLAGAAECALMLRELLR